MGVVDAVLFLQKNDDDDNDDIDDDDENDDNDDGDDKRETEDHTPPPHPKRTQRDKSIVVKLSPKCR